MKQTKGKKKENTETTCQHKLMKLFIKFGLKSYEL